MAVFAKGSDSTWLYHRVRWGRPGFLVAPIAGVLAMAHQSWTGKYHQRYLQRIVPQMTASPKPNLGPAK